MPLLAEKSGAAPRVAPAPFGWRLCLLACSAWALVACPRADLHELGHNLNAKADAAAPTDAAGKEGGAGDAGDADVGDGAVDASAADTGAAADAAMEASTADAGSCPDDDGDGVCNADDSCPTVPNAGDDTGAACACNVTVPTGTVTASAELSSGDTRAGYVGNVDINGSGKNVLAVAPGADLSIRFGWAATLCYFAGTGGVGINQYIVIGLDGGGTDCAVKADCQPHPGNCLFKVGGATCDLAEMATATLTAPSQPGTYDLLMDHDTGSCSGWPKGVPGTDQRIGAICVQ